MDVQKMSTEAEPVGASLTQRLHVLQHSLGLNQYGGGASSRNYFVTSAGTTDWPICVEAVADGLMTQTKGNPVTGGADVFRVTPAGIAWVKERSPQAPKLTRAQRRYREYLRADNGMTFGEWLNAYATAAAA